MYIKQNIKDACMILEAIKRHLGILTRPLVTPFDTLVNLEMRLGSRLNHLWNWMSW